MGAVAAGLVLATAVKLGGYVQLDGALDIKGDQGRGVSLSDLPLDGSAGASRRNTSTLSARSMTRPMASRRAMKVVMASPCRLGAGRAGG